jgi:hypothetical protein
MRKGCVRFVWVEANDIIKVRFLFTRLDKILRTTSLLLFSFCFSFAFKELSSCHTHRTLPLSSGDENSEDAAIMAYVVDTLLDVARRVKGGQAKDVAGPIVCDITGCNEDT